MSMSRRFSPQISRRIFVSSVSPRGYHLTANHPATRYLYRNDTILDRVRKKTPYFEKLLFSSLSLKISTPPHVDSGPLIFHYLRDPPLFPTFSTLEPAGSFDVVATQLLATARPNIFLEVGRVRGRTIHVWNHICE